MRLNVHGRKPSTIVLNAQTEDKAIVLDNSAMLFSMKHISNSPARRAIAHNVRRLRLAKGWSQIQLAHKAGVAQTAISYIENPDGKSPSLEMQEAIAAAFGLPYWALSLPLDDLGDDDLASIDVIVKTFVSAPEDGRRQMRRIAETEARYIAIPRLPPPDNHAPR